MSFSRTVKDELLKKDFTVSGKTYNIGGDDAEREKSRLRLRESFLKGGSVTDPKKDYHLEFVCRSAAEAEHVMEELSGFSLHPRRTERNGYRLVYLKDASEISDVLNIIGAHEALMEFENVRILKELSENVNRRVNFETANINRTVRASLRQLEDIQLIEERMGLETLEEGLRKLALMRKRLPDASLEELAASLEPPIGKSGVNHRMRRLGKIAAELRNSERSPEA